MNYLIENVELMSKNLDLMYFTDNLKSNECHYMVILLHKQKSEGLIIAYFSPLIFILIHLIFILSQYQREFESIHNPEH